MSDMEQLRKAMTLLAKAADKISSNATLAEHMDLCSEYDLRKAEREILDAKCIISNFLAVSRK